MPCLLDFHSIRPPFETTQEEILDWLSHAHAVSDNTGQQEMFAKTLAHVGCKSEWLARRGHILPDFLHRNWAEMQVYQLHESKAGVPLSKRMEYFATHVDQVFETYYDAADAPDDLIHVSCTGYVAPSGAQKIVAKKGWGSKTTVTHAYHMGCYGAFPALRIGSGFLKDAKQKVDIVHTEICSLHLNPSLHTPEQFVSQSLFSDGFIKYSLLPETKKPHFKILAIHEEIIPNSTEMMTWDVGEWGHQFSLSKKIPLYLTRALAGYLNALCEKASLPLSMIQTAQFAIHPGGPKILTQIQKLLQLEERQMTHSFSIFKAYGNMSSATLPHIWEAILKEKSDALLISLAFGPGLSIAGSIMQKCGG